MVVVVGFALFCCCGESNQLLTLKLNKLKFLSSLILVIAFYCSEIDHKLMF